jgi:hypothetical protein
VKRSYLYLFLAVLGLAVALALAGRMPRGAGSRDRAAPAIEAPAVAVSIEIKDGAIDPATVAVPKDHRVRLTVVNHDARTAQITLSGYEDRVQIPPLRPRDHWTGTFLADRPGGDFAWVLNGVPTGRFAVTGSHLEEGHR